MPVHFAVAGQAPDPLLDLLVNCHPLRRGIFDRSDHENMSRLDALGCLIKVGEDPADFLERLLEGDPVGFDVRYDQVRDASWSTVWRFLRHACPVVHHKYDNLLELRVRLAPQGPLYFDPEVLEDDLNRLADLRREHDVLLQGGEVLDVWQRDLDASRVCEFLGFECPPLGPPVPEDFRARIENYDELREAFRGRPGGEYF